MTAISQALDDAIGDVYDRVRAVDGITDVLAGVAAVIATDGAMFYVGSSAPRDDLVAKLEPLPAGILATRLREAADRLAPPARARADLGAAADRLNARADALGAEAGSNPDLDVRLLLAGLDVDAKELADLSSQYAHQVALDLAGLDETDEDAADDFVTILAGFWKHAAIVGVLAAQDAT